MTISSDKILSSIVNILKTATSEDTYYIVDASYSAISSTTPEIDTSTYASFIEELKRSYGYATKLTNSLDLSNPVLVNDSRYGIFVISKGSPILLPTEIKGTTKSLVGISAILSRLPIKATKALIQRVFTDSSDIAYEFIPGKSSRLGTVLVDFSSIKDTSTSTEIVNKIYQYLGSQEFTDTLSVKSIEASIIQGLLGNNSSASSSSQTESSSTKVTKLNKVRQTPSPQLRERSGRFYSLNLLTQLIKDSLLDKVSSLMGTGSSRKVLNYRSGRFAESVEVKTLSQGRTGMITAFYTYMKYPYQTFEPGFAQGHIASRDPKLLIAKAIREIAATRVKNRMRAVLI